MKLNKLFVVVFVVAVLFSSVFPTFGYVFAQDGECPPGSLERSGFQGLYPGDTKVCFASPGLYYYRDVSDEIPCDNAVTIPAIYQVIGPEEHIGVVYLVQPLSTNLNGTARVRFLYMANYGYVVPGENEDRFTIEIYDRDLARISVEGHYFSEFQSVVASTGGLIPQYYNLYAVDQLVTTSPDLDPGSMVRLAVYRPTSSVPVPLPGTDVLVFRGVSRLAGFQASTSDGSFPDFCSHPGIVWPTATPIPTPINQPTGTPTPTGTYIPPTNTPTRTPYPTSAAGTPTIYPTVTTAPLVFPTIQSEWTPTPWPPYNIPPVAWPTAGPTYMAAAIPTLDTTGLDLSDLADQINDDWNDSLTASQEGLDGSITGTTGIAPPDTIAARMAEDISKPIAYAKTIGRFMPNAAGYITRFIWLAAWVVFSRNARFFLSIAVKLFELIRRIWEMIPFVG